MGDLVKRCLEEGYLLVFLGHGCVQLQLPLLSHSGKLTFQSENLVILLTNDDVLGGKLFLMGLAGQCIPGLLLGFMLFVQRFDTASDLVVEFCVLDLVDDGSVISFIHGKNTSALRAFKLFHGFFVFVGLSSCYFFYGAKACVSCLYSCQIYKKKANLPQVSLELCNGLA